MNYSNSVMFVNSTNNSFQLRKSQFAKELLTYQTVKTPNEMRASRCRVDRSLAESLPHINQLAELADCPLAQLQLSV